MSVYFLLVYLFIIRHPSFLRPSAYTHLILFNCFCLFLLCSLFRLLLLVGVEFSSVLFASVFACAVPTISSLSYSTAPCICARHVVSVLHIISASCYRTIHSREEGVLDVFCFFLAYVDTALLSLQKLELLMLVLVQ